MERNSVFGFSVSVSFSEVKCHFIKTRIFLASILCLQTSFTLRSRLTKETGKRWGNIINFLSVCLTFVSLNLFVYLFRSFNAECNLTSHYPEGFQTPNTRREKRERKIEMDESWRNGGCVCVLCHKRQYLLNVLGVAFGSDILRVNKLIKPTKQTV